MKTNDWLVRGLSEEQIDFVELSSNISSLIQLDQWYTGLSDKDYAKKIGVSMRKLNAYKSVQYNFTLKDIARLRVNTAWRFQIGLPAAFAPQEYQASSNDAIKSDHDAIKS